MTADILTEKGTCDDGRIFAKIDNHQYTVPKALAGDLDKFSIGEPIGFNETNNIISRFWKKRKTEKQQYITIPPNGNGNGKNQKLIVMQHNFTVVTDLFIASHPLENLDFPECLKEIYTETKKITDEMMKDCEVVQG